MFAAVGESLAALLLLLLLWLRPGLSIGSRVQTNFSYEITVPQQVLSLEGKHDKETLSYVINADGRQRVLILQQKTILVPKNILVFTYNRMGTLQSEESNIQNCFYHGYVDGVKDSLVAMSTCSGLQGFMKTDNFTYGIEPVESSATFQHFIYRMDDARSKCGVTKADEKRYSYEFSHHFDPALYPQMRVESPVAYCIELFIVVDNERMFKPLAVSVRLVGMEIWTTINFIDLNGNPSTILDRFLEWKETKLVQRVQFDTAILIVQKISGDARGISRIGTICAGHNSGILGVFPDDNVEQISSILAHQLGHTVGMYHDKSDCSCGAEACIMAAEVKPNALKFSNCSADYFKRLSFFGGTECLKNIPVADSLFAEKTCGNGVVEDGEECDCGKITQCTNDGCCHPVTCQWMGYAVCAYGKCCSSCQFTAAGTPCRKAATDCDLPEYCNGTYMHCQPDVYKQDGTRCNNDNSLCKDGDCYDYNKHCIALFGEGATVAPETCFKLVNTKGDRFGNCGFVEGYRKCDSKDSMCGRLQCVGIKGIPVFRNQTSVVQTTLNKTICWGMDHHFAIDTIDKGAVKDGARCGNKQVCVMRQCVSESMLKKDCNEELKCNRKGVCNNKNNCHCDRGWSPPNCQDKGYGGSIDSGPKFAFTYRIEDDLIHPAVWITIGIGIPLIIAAIIGTVFFLKFY
ncbi:disintegrin and metalloproteinase domain-containing protein 9-like isoform X2 [Rhinatrema bivittatum]|uniref:disintegrin and metalloproteinase domain-containing protein 9-like isoform X2 n=1 Tax=Rhinatrema bivittatum TaxID=194408 RepID=UPI00112CDE2E|nr:disintegrin and metalloproteinase domain-containing protein 9-like isoform X2 [Rhinatrema bivittatum]